MGIPRPDAFAPAITNGTLVGRECHLGFWADHYSVPIGGQYGNFDAWFHIDTSMPLEFSGITIPTIMAKFEHKNMIPIFDYLPGYKPTDSKKVQDNEPTFFPDFVGSWDAFDQMWLDFEKEKGSCLPV